MLCCYVVLACVVVWYDCFVLCLLCGVVMCCCICCVCGLRDCVCCACVVPVLCVVVLRVGVVLCLV